MIIDGATFRWQQTRGFLVLDGVNGAGKSTQLARIVDHLQRRGAVVVSTREPGATELGKSLRPLLLSSAEKPCQRAELFLFAADRSEHVEKVIRPALSSGKLVVSDRYYYSTAAFQGYGRQLNLAAVDAINQIAIDGLRPDLVIILDLDPHEGLRRAQSRSTAPAAEVDNFEQEQLAFHQRLRDGFLKLAESCPEPFLVVDAARPADSIWAELRPVVERWADASAH